MDSSAILRIAKEEWRYWLRAKVALAACAVVLLLVVTSLVTTFSRVESERINRVQLQTTAERRRFLRNRHDTRTAWCTMATMYFAPLPL